jgi:hypothetical protein
MKVRAQIRGLDFGRRLARIAEAAAAPAVEAAADALAGELARARADANLSAPLLRTGTPRRRRVGANDPESLGRELGSPVRAPAPWLTPVLPGARSPMRAAALARVRDVVAPRAT